MVGFETSKVEEEFPQFHHDFRYTEGDLQLDESSKSCGNIELSALLVQHAELFHLVVERDSADTKFRRRILTVMTVARQR